MFGDKVGWEWYKPLVKTSEEQKVPRDSSRSGLASGTL